VGPTHQTHPAGVDECSNALALARIQQQHPFLRLCDCAGEAEEAEEAEEEWEEAPNEGKSRNVNLEGHSVQQ